MALTGYRV
ncbi:hypothetical protein VTL71DRAFT_3003 [Oculimacula yallundae]|uniref:Uncharacterized protein n=1 Tax=Oculimacula yallundae TaxID=86028 RepID=A0ABR4C5V8_9HELO